jgi:hypothetical protein
MAGLIGPGPEKHMIRRCRTRSGEKHVNEHMEMNMQEDLCMERYHHLPFSIKVAMESMCFLNG